MTAAAFSERRGHSSGGLSTSTHDPDSCGSQPSLRVMVHPSILERLRSEDAELLVRMEKLFGVKLAFRADLNYHVENFKIINAMTNEEYR